MIYKTILEALTRDTGVRVTASNHKWLYVDETTKEFVVMEQGYRKRKAITVYRGESESQAITILCE